MFRRGRSLIRFSSMPLSMTSSAQYCAPKSATYKMIILGDKDVESMTVRLENDRILDRFKVNRLVTNPENFK